MMEYMKDSNWIWSPVWSAEDKDCPRIMLFRKKIEMEEEPYGGRIKISADTRYKLYINERLVEVGPSRGDHQVWFYDTVDILPYLKKGMNVIGVSVLRYPEDPASGNHGMFRTSVPGLYLTGKVEDMDGNKYDVSADASWKCIIDKNVTFYREEERFAPLIIHENTAGNPMIFGWKKVRYDDSHWKWAKPYIKKLVPEAVSPGNLKPRNIPYMYRKKGRFQDIMDLKKSDYTREEWVSFLREEKEIVIPAHREVILELDAGEEMTGYIKAAFSGGKNARVSLLYSEAYVQEGFVGPEHIPVKADRIDKENGHLQGYEDNYQVAGKCTVAMRFYLFRALEKTGLYAYTNQYWETWRNMIKMHCTTCVESEAYSRSECHGWGALILYELPCTVLGVRPAEPGYRKVRIAPTPGYLTHASGHVKTPVGDIKVSWKIENGVFKIEHEVPQDIQVI